MSAPTTTDPDRGGTYSRGEDGTVPAFDDVNRHLADLEAEPRDPDPVIAAEQDDRDRSAYRGDWVRADAAAARVLDLRMTAELDDRERE